MVLSPEAEAGKFARPAGRTVADILFQILREPSLYMTIAIHSKAAEGGEN